MLVPPLGVLAFSREQKYDATLKMARESNAKAGIYRDASRPWPKPVPVRTPPERHDWDFFYRSLQAAPELRPTILAKMCSGTTPVFKSELRTPKGNYTLRTHRQETTRNASRHTEAAQR